MKTIILIYALLCLIACSNPTSTSTTIDNIDTASYLIYNVEYRAEGILGNWTSETYVKYKILEDTTYTKILILKSLPWSKCFIGKTGDILYLASNTNDNQLQKTRLSVYVDGILMAVDSTTTGEYNVYNDAEVHYILQ